MKKKITLALLMASLLLIVSACSKRNDENPIAKTISYRNITEIVASTQMTDMKQDIVLDEGNCRKLLDKLTSYSMNKIDGEIDKNGWEYLFRIKQGIKYTPESGHDEVGVTPKIGQLKMAV